MQQDRLRERKKARTRAAIRDNALRLFREQGYHATTVEQIAAAAEVSPSTFFRYFPTKEDVVLGDDFDERMFGAFERQPPDLTPVAAIRAAIREAIAAYDPQEWARFREMSAFAMSVSEVRARSLDELARTIDAMAEAVAKRTGRASGDLAVRAYAGAVLGVVLSVLTPDLGDAAVDDQLYQRIDEALALLESGLPL
ncbi:TetR family transcriptional regulator [Actinocrinis puniceicyclus]|uniref:TetR family transcriptional regulator n=1 Tax=Actinocrinis puniceicyclus TaxID=977794 RepID=A0A8J7WVA9_9ACTN|nr:TetR family transcriptional regulator [Actinocrinis puniceicyclus]MBS2966779.1 TetR family transcriptional regulator [Actinocrinis puniceicyclus]